MTKIALLFPGQGAQYVGMGKDLYENSPAAKNIFDKASALMGEGFLKTVFEGPEEDLKRCIFGSRRMRNRRTKWNA